MQVRDPSPDVHLDSRSSKKMRRTDRQRETTRIGGQSRSCNLWGATPASRSARRPVVESNLPSRPVDPGQVVLGSAHGRFGQLDQDGLDLVETALTHRQVDSGPDRGRIAGRRLEGGLHHLVGLLDLSDQTLPELVPVEKEARPIARSS